MHSNIRIESGDLISYFKEGKVDCILHCANAQNTMNSGIAKQIRENFPAAYEADCLTKKGDPKKLGSFTLAFIGEQIIFNCYGQQFYGYDSKQYLSYDALLKSFENVRDWLFAASMSNCTIGLPVKIGCHRAGGDWNKVLAMINYVFGRTSLNVVLVEYDGKNK